MIPFSASVLFSLGAVGPLSEPPAIAVGSVVLDERQWSIGRTPTLTFTVSPSRGPFEKVAAFVYISNEPQAYFTSTYQRQFVGVFLTPESASVPLALPERGPINEFTREKFVQGALFDMQTGAFLGVTNEDYFDIAYGSKPVSFTLDFETEDDFATPLVNGQDISTPPEFGRLVSIRALQPAMGPQHQGAAIFDSDPEGPNVWSSDPDLLVDRGNVLILQENPGQTVSGVFDLPDDSANGGTLAFEFSGFSFIEKVRPLSIDLVDIDSGSPRSTRVVLTDVLGRTRTYVVPPGWTEDISHQGPPGVRTLDLTTLAPQPGFAATATASETLNYIPGEIVSLEVELGGSGAVDQLLFEREADPGLPSKRSRR